MQRSLAAYARAHLPWIALLAILASAIHFWSHLDDYLLADLNGLSLMTGIETLSAAEPVAARDGSPATPCGGLTHHTVTAAPPATGRATP